jgi:hypothetical protein
MIDDTLLEPEAAGPSVVLEAIIEITFTGLGRIGTSHTAAILNGVHDE